MKCGDDGLKDTPVPMPNTEVKLQHAESSWGIAPCEDRTLPRKGPQWTVPEKYGSFLLFNNKNEVKNKAPSSKQPVPKRRNTGNNAVRRGQTIKKIGLFSSL